MKEKKGKKQSAKRLLKKGLQEQLSTAIQQVIEQYGKAKKSKALIDKFSKKLAKNIVITPIAEVEVIELEPEKTTKPEPKKKTTKATSKTA